MESVAASPELTPEPLAWLERGSASAQWTVNPGYSGDRTLRPASTAAASRPASSATSMSDYSRMAAARWMASALRTPGQGIRVHQVRAHQIHQVDPAEYGIDQDFSCAGGGAERPPSRDHITSHPRTRWNHRPSSDAHYR